MIRLKGNHCVAEENFLDRASPRHGAPDKKTLKRRRGSAVKSA